MNIRSAAVSAAFILAVGFGASASVMAQPANSGLITQPTTEQTVLTGNTQVALTLDEMICISAYSSSDYAKKKQFCRL